ncbi:MAG: TIGR00730 family Rossman fold protein [Alphaproteobacteria bacterium]|nr:TIGR00730 family Rossman fold protein [Alphaproteobacteria bacterium]|tara:strand:+ start:67 stop:630 length:564 start_codon:yes stop_codon:yes gene_type:complete
MNKIETICVYCGASSNGPAYHREVAKDLGVILAREKIRLVYGGGSTGVMGALADSVINEGGFVTGIIPEFLLSHEMAHQGVNELKIVKDMHERKALMASKSQGFVILPGGIGTLEEFFEIVTWKQLGVHNKPIVVLNVMGFWNNLTTIIDSLITSGYMREENKELLKFVEKTDDILPQMQKILEQPS